MKKLFISIIIVLLLSIPVFAADIKYPSEQMINRCFLVGDNLWNVKRQVAQLSLDYEWDIIWYSYKDNYGEGVRLFKWLDNDGRSLEIIIYLKNNRIFDRNYLVSRNVGLVGGGGKVDD
jgi:hypothetical protein